MGRKARGKTGRPQRYKMGTRTVVAYGLAFFMFMAGLNKLTPLLSEHFHEELKNKLDNVYAPRVWGFLPLEGPQLRYLVGATEVVCGLMTPSSRFAVKVLCVVLLCAIHSHLIVNDGEWQPAALCLFMALYTLFASEHSTTESRVRRLAHKVSAMTRLVTIGLDLHETSVEDAVELHLFQHLTTYR
ncbi:hypothetical protein CYMTET_6894 [Cymbomonas tetramitiformis]|uniref:Transmembrane protein 35B n=1 Tax=Cymbomonas tetramitiformis TaxID=36881 RepID=A0AAE0GWI6_9CHLO|nr:hypothetical protein CYMTET_6894 [Cymbomonas tetramitiformis]